VNQILLYVSLNYTVVSVTCFFFAPLFGRVGGGGGGAFPLRLFVLFSHVIEAHMLVLSSKC